MISLRPQGGYTIIEVMIFLAVSALLFTASAATINQQNRRSEVAQAARDLENKLQDIFNDVDTGYYAVGQNIRCERSGGVPTFPTATAANKQGENEDCIFLGKALHFAPNSDTDRLDIHTIVGLRADGSGQPFKTVEDTKPVLYPNVKESLQLKADMHITDIRFPGQAQPYGLAVLTDFGGLPTTTSGSIKAHLAYINNGQVSSSFPTFEAGVGGLKDSSKIPTDQEIYICLKQGKGLGSSKHAAISVGKDSQRFALETYVDDAIPSSWGCPS